MNSRQKAEILQPNTEGYLEAVDELLIGPEEARIIALDLATKRHHIETVSESPEYIVKGQYMFYMYPLHAGFNEGVLVDGMCGRAEYQMTMHINMKDD